MSILQAVRTALFRGNVQKRSDWQVVNGLKETWKGEGEGRRIKGWRVE